MLRRRVEDHARGPAGQPRADVRAVDVERPRDLHRRGVLDVDLGQAHAARPVDTAAARRARATSIGSGIGPGCGCWRHRLAADRQQPIAAQQDLLDLALELQRAEQLRGVQRDVEREQPVAVDDVGAAPIGLDDVRLVDRGLLVVGAGVGTVGRRCARTPRWAPRAPRRRWAWRTGGVSPVTGDPSARTVMPEPPPVRSACSAGVADELVAGAERREPHLRDALDGLALGLGRAGREQPQRQRDDDQSPEPHGATVAQKRLLDGHMTRPVFASLAQIRCPGRTSFRSGLRVVRTPGRSRACAPA